MELNICHLYPDLLNVYGDVGNILILKNRLNNDGILVLTQGATPATLKLPPIEVVVEREDFTRVYVKEHDDRFQTIHILDLYHSKDRLENQQ